MAELNETRTIVSNPGKTYSKVWNYFGFYKIQKPGEPPKVDKSKLVCRAEPEKCQWVSSATATHTTSNMWTHLKSQHKHLLPKIENQPKVTEFVETKTPKLPAPRIESLNLSVAEYMIDSLVPFSTADGKGFKKLMGNAAPGYKVPCGNTFSRSIIPKLYEKEKNHLKSVLVEAHYPAITHDMWTSIATESYSTMTVHYISDTWELKGI